jgi:WD40 repeat protein
MISGSVNKITQLWDLQTGKEIEEARVVCDEEVNAVVVSRDGRWIVTVDGNNSANGPKLKACEVKKGIVKTFKEHSRHIGCIDISKDSKLLASGSWDSTTRIWSLDTGKLVAGPFKSAHYLVGAVRFSQDSKKLAVSSATGNHLEVWDIETQKLVVRKDAEGRSYFLRNSPVFWTTQDKTIVAAYSDDGTIYEFNASTLETIGAPFEGHTKHIRSLALSFDCALLVSSSYDQTIKLWAFESRQLLASFHIQGLLTVILSPDARQVAYTTFGPSPRKVYICNIPPNILANIWPSVCAY